MWGTCPERAPSVRPRRRGRRLAGLLVAVLFAVLFALVAAPASAEAKGWREHARQVATDTFGTPACGQPHIIRADPATYAPEQADWLRSATAWADPERCAIVLNSRERIHTSWRFCHVVVHEWGHLVLGDEEAHSDDPASIMYPYVIGTEGKVRRRAHGRWRWAATGYYAPCKPPKVSRHGGTTTGSFVN